MKVYFIAERRGRLTEVLLYLTFSDKFLYCNNTVEESSSSFDFLGLRSDLFCFNGILDKEIINGADKQPTTINITGKIFPHASIATMPIIIPNKRESFAYLIVSKKRNFSDCFGVTIKVAFLPSKPKNTVLSIIGASDA